MATQLTPQTQNGHVRLSSDKSKLISPEALCHIVLRTTADNFDGMVDFYLTMLGGRVSHQSHRLCFMTYDYEHHRIAIMKDPTAVPRSTKEGGAPQVGLHHVAFGFKTLQDLATSYEEKKAAGIMPVWSVNHGVSTSMYYEDPDGNQLEFQVDNFGSALEGVESMASPEFVENPIGVDFDPEVFVQRVKNGEDEKSIKARPNIGLRDRR
ncbi:Glyoxalase/Bleomycin resistance protein/Dihydroxybiphenyl dioxygenase [Daldinia caldariorum]|uniref:Glyoxalase/Bleomycin resistance protein/Dihydroxybiphenyl dioxygenase n=1 Tax=Daldinia caldariorum TaxID=326644 RepID=UPI00200869BF|nr:Glyoxalase/Bleomycin resistance protein/Dihydroxybiphenyl dioxygenase [Daldinia caldariorum]KAI1467125.1 Glyoxalase/Bleomycin resistance protein/Dihydroxybiphenyl dioxygenase [Daldinia caldariorum]